MGVKATEAENYKNRNINLTATKVTETRKINLIKIDNMKNIENVCLALFGDKNNDKVFTSTIENDISKYITF